jgi:molybdate transport system regulatory protein
LTGKVSKVSPGAVNTEIVLKLKGGAEVVSIITNQSAQALALKVKDTAQAVIKASSVMLAVE